MPHDRNGAAGMRAQIESDGALTSAEKEAQKEAGGRARKRFRLAL
jgi:hypothetical protein